MSTWCDVHEYNGKQVVVMQAKFDINEQGMKPVFRTLFYPRDFDEAASHEGLLTLSENASGDPEARANQWVAYASKTPTLERIEAFLKDHKNL